MVRPRLSYEQSCRQLQKLQYLDEGAVPPLQDHLPGALDDEPLGVSFFRTHVGPDDLRHLSLPRTFFGRSKIVDVSFCNCDLSESNLCWNDFIDVDFSDAVLAGSDLRSSRFQRVKFIQADLRRADLRRSSFEDCDFQGALIQGAVATRDQKKKLGLTASQIAEISWTKDVGEEPDGG